MSIGTPIAIYYEHPDWFRPLFDELSRRGIPHQKLHAGRVRIDPQQRPPYSFVFNRMSPSAWKRQLGDAIHFTSSLLHYLETAGVDVFNGSRAWMVETSKSSQLSLLAGLGAPAPRTRAVHSLEQLLIASGDLVFPLITKPNIGGSGAGIRKYETPEELAAAIESGAIDRGLDGVLLVQEFHRPRSGVITRIETLNGSFLYGIRLHLGEGAGFDLCPADICQTVGGEAISSAACPAGSQKAGIRVERFDPPAPIVRTVERIVRTAGIDVGGVEYLESERDGGIYFYDINALSNFVADPVSVIGFDPTARLVDALAARLARRAA